MPSKFDKRFSFETLASGKDPFETEVFLREFMECPQCKYKIPIRPELVDYKELYERQIMVNNKIQDYYMKMFKEADQYFPGLMKWLLDRNKIIISAMKAIIISIMMHGESGN